MNMQYGLPRFLLSLLPRRFQPSELNLSELCIEAAGWSCFVERNETPHQVHDIVVVCTWTPRFRGADHILYEEFPVWGRIDAQSLMDKYTDCILRGMHPKKALKEVDRFYRRNNMSIPF